MKYDTYIFDLDGTLLSTLEDLKNSCNFALSSFGLPERTLEEVRQFVGNGVELLMKRAVPNDTDDELFTKVFETFKEQYLIHNLDTTKPYDGVLEMLDELNRAGKNIAVVSNKFYEATVELCRHFFGDRVRVAIGERADIRKKPAPDTVDEAFKLLGVSRENAVYIGDSDVDLATARNSNLPCISVLWGFRDKDFLIEHGGNTFVTEPSQILDI
mgnify:FL=1